MVFPSSISNHPDINTIGLVDVEMLEHIWVPQVMVPHQKMTKCVHGPPFHDQVLNIVIKNETVWVDFWSLVKPTITCPMSFNWYPFDVQNCFMAIQVQLKVNAWIMIFYHLVWVSNWVHGLKKPAQIPGFCVFSFSKHSHWLWYQYSTTPTRFIRNCNGSK